MWIAGHPGASDVGRWMSGGPWKRIEVGTRGLKGGRASEASDLESGRLCGTWACGAVAVWLKLLSSLIAEGWLAHSARGVDLGVHK